MATRTPTGNSMLEVTRSDQSPLRRQNYVSLVNISKPREIQPWLLHRKSYCLYHLP